jgi:regulatory protein
MDLAFRMLGRRARSAAEIEAALAARGASRTLTGKVLGRLRALGYIDDEKLVSECIERWKERGFGVLRVQAEMRRLGIDEALVERVSFDERAERARARRLMEGRFSPRELGDRRGMARAARFLASRGFPEEVIDSLFDVCD